MPPVYDSPATLDEELPWIRVDKPTLPAVAPEQIYKDCYVHDNSISDNKYYFQVGDLVCKNDSDRVWMCLHEARCNDVANQVPWVDDLIPSTLLNTDPNPSDVDGKEPAWMLTHYLGKKIPLPTFSCIQTDATWDYEYNFLMDDCVIDDNGIVWICKHPELCHLIDARLPLFRNDDATTSSTTWSVHQRYGVGVWMPASSKGSTNTLVHTMTNLADDGCFRGDAFPPNSPFVTGSKVCIQPTSYGPYRYEKIINNVGDNITFKWDPSSSDRTNNDGFRRVFECVGGDLCNKIYPLEDLKRHLPNADNGEIFEFIANIRTVTEIPRHEMSEEEQIRTASKS